MYDRPPLYPHQIQDLEFLAGCPTAALFWEQGLAKSREVVEFLNRTPKIKKVVIFTPAQCRNVWESLDPENPSELLKYLDRSFDLLPYNLPARFRKTDGDDLTIVTCSLEVMALGRHAKQMIDLCKQLKPDLVVCDESSFIRNHAAARTKHVTKAMSFGRRRQILNGTPTANHELDLFSQYQALEPNILGFRSYYQFRARHAVMGGFQDRQVVGIQNVDEIYRKTAPFTRRRLKKDHLPDLPEKVELPALEVQLSAETWKMYREMRQDLVTWFDKNPSLATNGAVKALRLAQLTSGYLGGLVDGEGRPIDARCVSSEKTRALLDYLRDRRDAGEGMQTVWARFQPEIARLVELARSEGWIVYEIHGKANPEQRRRAKQVFQYGAQESGGSLLVAHEAAAGVGLTLVACHESTTLSRDYNYISYAQARDRFHRGGQHHPVSYRDVLATGPDGQKTIDHQFRKMVARKEDINLLGSAAWIRLITEE